MRNRTTRQSVLACLAVISVAVPGVSSQQEHTDGRVTIGISLSDGIDGSFRLYAERDHLEYNIRISNESEALISADQEVLRRVFAIRVELGGTEIPIDVRWPDEVSVQDRTDIGIVTPFASWQPIQLNPDEAVWINVSLERQDRQRFEEGRYEVVFAVTGFETAIRRADGTAWQGYTNARGSILRSTTIRRPATPQEQLAAYQADAILARRRGDREAALEALLKATALEPDNRYVRLSLGLAYRGLGRYREAIPIYESLLAGAVTPDPQAARELAQAYLGVRDEGNAARVLRWSGVPEGGIRDEIETLRRGLR